MSEDENITTLTHVSINPDFFDKMEREVRRVMREHFFERVLRAAGHPDMPLANSTSAVFEGLQSGRIYFNRGIFLGRFSAQISRELKQLGAKWDRKNQGWRILMSDLPVELRVAIRASEDRWHRTADKIDDELRKIVPEEIADKMSVEKIFDDGLWDVQKKIDKTLKSISVNVVLTKEQREQIAKEYTNNMKRSIKEWTEKEIVTLRGRVQERAMAGLRYEGLAKEIQARYDVSASKAKFLARQETNLMLAQFKKSRYEAAGVDSYEWRCVAGSADHPVRHSHKILEGKVYKWSDPPITDGKGSRNNPGEDYNCRCFALPVVRF